MHARDVVGVVFDEYIPDEGVHLSRLSTLFAALEIEPATVRATVARMRREGLLFSRRIGRETIYRASDEYRSALDEDRARSYRLASDKWAGTWTIVLYQIPEAERGRREKLKRILLDDGFGQLNATTWVSPHDDRERMHRMLGCHDDPTIVVLNASTGGLTEDLELVDKCWELDEIAGGYRAFLERWGGLAADCEPSAPDAAFRARVEIISDWRHFPSHDPRLPRALQPAGWPAQQALEIYHRAESCLRRGAQAFVDATFGAPSP
ncbi:PaaX family transcriptional regulator C-terminal domain-containing protein [Microbacterium sp. SY138]|uniref:PaaX family transcriptional regulator n=1 Tax=unclassified Microbacterium TaxID=2609290 RepID=UPI003219B057